MGAKRATGGVDWSKLEYATGEAAGMPALLENLRKKSRSDRDWYFERLEDALIGEGRIFSASVPAVGALVALARDDTLKDRGRLLALAFDIVTEGRGRWLVDRRGGGAGEKWRGLAADAREMALSRIDDVRALLADSDAHVRAAAAYGLSLLLEDAVKSAALLDRAAKRERDPVVRAAMLFALAHAARVRGPKGSAVEILAAHERAAKDPFVRSAAALAALLDETAKARDEGADLYVPFLAAGAVDAGLFPFHEGFVAGLGGAVLATRKAAGRKIALAALERAVTRAGENQEAVAGALVDLAFGESDVARAPGDLSKEQRALLVRLAELPLTTDTFVRAGLPQLPEERKRFLGLAAPAALDRPIRKGKSTVPLWNLVADLQDRREPEDRVLEALGEAGLSVADVAEALVEMARAVHGLRPFSGTVALQAFAGAGAAGIEIAGRFVDDLSTAHRPGTVLGVPPDFVNAMLLTLARARGGLDARHAPLVQAVPPEALTSELFARVAPAVREEAILRALEPQWQNPTRSITNAILRVVPYLALCPTTAVATRLLEMTEKRRLKVIDSDLEASFARRTAVGALEGVAEGNAPVRAALEKAGAL